MLPRIHRGWHVHSHGSLYLLDTCVRSWWYTVVVEEKCENLPEKCGHAPLVVHDI